MAKEGFVELLVLYACNRCIIWLSSDGSGLFAVSWATKESNAACNLRTSYRCLLKSRALMSSNQSHMDNTMVTCVLKIM